MSSARSSVVQFIHTINVFVFGALGLGALFLASSVVPGVTVDTKAGIRSFGAISLVMSMLLSSLGPTHHGGYCLTMTLHFILMGVNAVDLLERTLPDGSFQPQLAVQTVFNAFMFVLMLGILINGGIGGDHGHGKSASNVTTKKQS